jgi:cysteine-rich repeat protein
MMKLAPHLTRTLGLATLLVACTGDDTSSGTESTTDATATSNPTTTASSTSAGTGTTTGGETDTVSGSQSNSDSDSTTFGTDPTGSASDTDDTTSDSTTMPVTTTDTTGGGTCGDGNLDEGELCDDGNNDNGDGCDADCQPEIPTDCGNGELNEGESCDGDNLPQTDCKQVDEQYSGGTLSCSGDCTYNFSACEKCEAPGDLAPCDADMYIKGDPQDILHAIELNCQTADPQFNDPNKHVPVGSYMPTQIATGSWRVIKQFGSYTDPNDNNLPLWRPRKGDKMLAISSGNLPAPNAQGVLTQAGGTVSGTNPNPDNQGDLPGVMNWEVGSNNGGGGAPFMNCHPSNDCSDTLSAQWNLGTKTANDVLYFQYTLATPKGTYGYVVDFAYFSSEYPSWVNTSFNDMAILWQVAEEYTGNVTFITDNNNNPRPLTVTALAQNGLMQFTGNAPQLANTGFVGNGGTGWATVKGPAKPAETFTVAWTVFDKADSILDTVLLIDNFAWDCEGCVPSEVDSCGVQPQ